MRKGIILAAGRGTRLHPVTRAISKQLLPVYNKPMIYYPLTTLMLGGVRDILVIVTPGELTRFQQLLQDGSQWGLSISYAIQEAANGIAQALIIGRRFLDGAHVSLILGDNIFYGAGLGQLIVDASRRPVPATIFGYQMRDPSRYGVARFDEAGRIREIVEKPATPPSRWAVTGLYLYDDQAPAIAQSVAPSKRGELEITDVNNAYAAEGKLVIERLGRGIAWFDTGTHESLHEAAAFVQTVERRQGLRIASPEELAWHMGFIGPEQLARLAADEGDSEYGEYLFGLLESEGR